MQIKTTMTHTAHPPESLKLERSAKPLLREDVDQLGLSKIAGRNGKQCSHFGKQFVEKLKIHLSGDPGHPSHPVVRISSRDEGDPCMCECSRTQPGQPLQLAGLELDLTLRTFCSDGSEQIRFHLLI